MNKIIYKSNYLNEYGSDSYFMVGYTENIEKIWVQLNTMNDVKMEFTDNALFSMKRKVYGIQFKLTEDKVLISVISAENIMVLLLNNKITEVNHSDIDTASDWRFWILPSIKTNLVKSNVF